MNRGLVAVNVAAAICAFGCGGSPAPEERRVPAPAAEPQRAIRVTRDDGSLPRGCGPRPTTQRVLGFLEAFNRGDGAAIDRAVAEEARFQWFSTAVRGLSEASIYASGASSVTDLADAPPVSQRPKLLSWLAKRHRVGERMRLVDISVSHVRANEWLPVNVELAGVEYVVERAAPDIDRLPGANRLATGKGGISCVDGVVLVWSMGLDPRRRPPRNLCPRPAPAASAAHVTACSGL